MIRPRPYISFSQMTTFEMSPERFIEQYIYGKKMRISRNIALGSMLAEGLEAEEFTGNPMLDIMMSRLPKFELMDRPVEDKKGVVVIDPHTKKSHKVPVLKDGKGLIPLLAKPDTAKADYTAFKEYKSSTKKWTQKMVDQSGQITFYCFAIWLKTGKIPADIELVGITTKYEENGALVPSGEIWRYKTTRTMVDMIKMSGRIKRAWAGIKELCEKEML